MTILSLLFYVAQLFIVPLFLIGLIRSMKARMQNRRGQSPLQPFFDTIKLLKKGETVSNTATWAFRRGPVAVLASTVVVGLMTPWLGIKPPIAGDLFLVVYLMALTKFCAGLAALDTGSSFGAIGASREAAISLQTEPAILLGLAALACRAHTSNLAVMLAGGASGTNTAVIAALVVVALWMAAMAELARMPIDDPTTHLELTMVHEAQILENSGPGLALMEYSAAMKCAVLLGLVAQVVLIPGPRISPFIAYGASLGIILVGAIVIAASESVLVKLRWRRVPNMLSYAVSASLLACLIVAMGGS